MAENLSLAPDGAISVVILGNPSQPLPEEQLRARLEQLVAPMRRANSRLEKLWTRAMLT